MIGKTNVAGGNDMGAFKKIKTGSVTAPEKVVFAFGEIDFINNDSQADLTVKFYAADASTVSGQLTIKAGEGIADINYKGGAIEFSGNDINVRYLLLG